MITKDNFFNNTVATFKATNEILNINPDYVSYKKGRAILLEYDSICTCYDKNNNIIDVDWGDEKFDFDQIRLVVFYGEDGEEDDIYDVDYFFRHEDHDDLMFIPKIIASKFYYTESGCYRSSSKWGEMRDVDWFIDVESNDEDVLLGFCKWSDFACRDEKSN
jgi:hypothetical protein